MSESMKHVPPDGLLPQLNAALGQLFQAHGVESSPRGDWLFFPDQGHTLNAQIVREMDNPKALILQLDVRLRLAGGGTLIESVGGWGPDLNAATNLALSLFVDGTFHVLLAAFFGRPVKEHAEQTEEIIGGRRRRLTSGLVTIPMGRPPETAPGLPDLRWFADFNARLRRKDLPPGTHWVRLYYCQSKGQMLECEVLLDNAPWLDFQAEMAGYDWPKTDQVYSVRWFLVIQDAPEAG